MTKGIMYTKFIQEYLDMYKTSVDKWVKDMTR